MKNINNINMRQPFISSFPFISPLPKDLYKYKYETIVSKHIILALN